MQHNPNSNPPVLGIALSTMDGRLAQNTTLVSQIAELKAPVVVVNQLRNGDKGRLTVDQLEWSESFAQILNLATLGLSKSRNVAIQTLSTPWAVLADDDVTLDLDGFQALATRIATDNALGAASHVGALSTRLMKDPQTPWRAYSSKAPVLEGRSFAALRKIQRINSMELVLNKAWLEHHGISFDERFGLGAPPTTGGEEVMLLNAVLQHGGQILPLDIPVRTHPEESSGQAINASTAFTQGAVHWMVFGGLWWWALFAAYMGKRLRKGGLSAAGHYARGGVWASRQA